jgi:hypothetical protein
VSLPSAPAAADSTRDAQAQKRFRRDETLNFQLFVYNASRDAGGTSDVALQAQVWAGPRMVASSALAAVPVPDQAAAPYSSSFPLASFAAGSYELRIAVHDRRSGQSQLRRVTFLLE